MREVVVTGMGVVAPLGTNVEEFRRRMFAGESGIVSIRGNEEPENFPVPFAAMVPNKRSMPRPDHLDEKRFYPDSVLFSASAAEQALEGMPQDLKFDAVICGTAEGNHFGIMKESFETFEKENFDWLEIYSESATELVNDLFEHQGRPSIPADNRISMNHACATGNTAIGVAMQRIRSGEWDRCITGAVEARCCSFNFLNFNMLDALTTDDSYPPHKASRPFSKDRSGFVRGEGAAFLILESREAAEARNASILAVVAGYGNTTDAFRLTDGRDDGSAVMKSIQTSVEDAGIGLEDIDYINAHGTSTPLNDRLETLAIKNVFGERAYDIPVSSLKSQIGHPAVAAGAIEAVACILMLQEQKVAPTMNCNVKDPDCDLDYVPNQAREKDLNYVLSNNFGFGGQNSCIVLRRS